MDNNVDSSFPLDDEDSAGTLFYRCCLCGGVVSKWDISESRGCPKCSHRKLRPSNLSLSEKIVQIFKHPKVWGW